MAHVIGTIREFETPRFKVIVDAIEELDIDLSWDDTGETAKKLDSGEYLVFTARARVILKETGSELASDYLGNCIYTSLESFADHIACGKQNREYEAAGIAGSCGSYFRQMIEQVCQEARQHLLSIQSVKVRG